MRRLGYSYNEIIRESGLAKSTLSEWLKNLPLTEEEKRYLKKRRDKNISHGRVKAATAHRKKRLERDKMLFTVAKEEFKSFIRDPLFHTGIALYWAEGSKRSGLFQFSNSDQSMMRVMILWVERFLGRKREEIFGRLYMHKPYIHEKWEESWSYATGIPFKNFKKTIYKPTGLLVKKRPHYRGCLRLEVPKSTSEKKKVVFWSAMLARYYKKQEEKNK